MRALIDLCIFFVGDSTELDASQTTSSAKSPFVVLNSSPLLLEISKSSEYSGLIEFLMMNFERYQKFVLVKKQKRHWMGHISRKGLTSLLVMPCTIPG